MDGELVLPASGLFAPRPLVPVVLGVDVPFVPGVVVLEPVRVRFVRDRVERDAVPRRAFGDAHGAWLAAELSFAATDPSAVAPVRFALPVALALPE